MSRPQAATCKSSIMCTNHSRGCCLFDSSQRQFDNHLSVSQRWFPPGNVSQAPAKCNVTFIQTLWSNAANSLPLRQQIRSTPATGTKSPLLSVQSFLLLMCIIVPGQRVFELDSLASGSSAADLLLHPALPLWLPVFPPPAARKAICGGFNGRKWAPSYAGHGTRDFRRVALLC